MNLLDSGEPPSATFCTRQCPHGTHVAGIAAGTFNNGLPTGLQGVAPDATLVSVQIFSWIAKTGWGAWAADILAALQAVNQNTATDTYTVNMSLGSGQYVADCPGINGVAIDNAIQALYSRNIPVVASAGNEQYRFGINWPACARNVIKAAGTMNDANGNTLAINQNGAGSNIAPDTFTGPVFLAPGWWVRSSIISGTTATESWGGTSMAAPHIAGFYAAFKAAVPGTTIANATAWIKSTGSVSAPQTFSGLGTYQFRRIRMP